MKKEAPQNQKEQSKEAIRTTRSGKPIQAVATHPLKKEEPVQLLPKKRTRDEVDGKKDKKNQPTSPKIEAKDKKVHAKQEEKEIIPVKVEKSEPKAPIVVKPEPKEEVKQAIQQVAQKQQVLVKSEPVQFIKQEVAPQIKQLLKDEDSQDKMDSDEEGNEGMNMKDDDSGDDDDDDGGDPDRKKQKRRSKNDVQGRDHKCNYCDKTYLSYPALYTHMKNKHAKGPDGQPLININSGRGRGRPKKNATGVRFSHVEPTSDEFFKTSDKNGGPIDPTSGFKEVYTEIYIKRAKIPDKRLEESQLMDGEQSEEKKIGEGVMNEDGEEQSNFENQVKNEEDINQEEERKGEFQFEEVKQQQEQISTHPPEKIKKKRGRKPKSFYLQQQQEQEKLQNEQMEKRKQEMQEAENEEEVKIRQDEYRSHPLFYKLESYADELKDYIEEKRKIQQQKQLEQQKEQEKKDAQSSYPDIKGGNIFCTQKVINNNSNLKTSIPQFSTKQVKTEAKEEKKYDKEESKNDKDDDDESKLRKEMEQEEERLKEKEEELRKDERMRKFMNMAEEDKDQLTCDEVFSMYLRYVSKHVNENFYRTCLKFILLYRECLNEYGWLKRRDHFQKAGLLDQDDIINKLRREEEKEEEIQKLKDQQSQHQESHTEADVDMKETQQMKVEEGSNEEEKLNEDQQMNEENKDSQADKMEEEDIYIPQAEYTAVCNGDFIPLICNEFVTEFLDKEHGACQIDRTEAIDLTRNFCYWVAVNGLTCAHISLYS